MPTVYTHLASPLGPLLITSNGHKITRLQMAGKTPRNIPSTWTESEEPFADVHRQLCSYFEGHRHAFNIPLGPAGTAFQRRVWTALQQIPFGATCTYGDLAHRLGHPRAAQAVGAANGQNPIAILIPCHRVVGADGSLTGYAGGLDRKQYLLRLEAKHSGLFAAS